MSEPVLLFRSGRGDEWRIMLEGDVVLFSYYSLFDREKDEWDVGSDSFDKGIFAQGIRQLFSDGRAEVHGRDSVLSLRLVGDEIALRIDIVSARRGYCYDGPVIIADQVLVLLGT